MRDLSSLKGDRTHNPSTLEGKVLTTRPPGKSQPPHFERAMSSVHVG